ncbi:MAG: hypothetical protein AAFN78_01030 [Pseudomonadota bacterium]
MTRDELQREVFLKMGVIATVDAVSGEEAEQFEKTYNRVYARLQAEGKATWQRDTDDIPDVVSGPVIDIMAYALSKAGYSLPQRVKADLYFEAENPANPNRAEIRLTTLPQGASTSESTNSQSTYF